MALCRYKAVSKYLKLALPVISKRNYTVQSAVENDAPTKINLDEKVAVITGGGSGIGYAIAKEFLREGLPCLTIVDKDKVRSLETVQQLSDEFGDNKVLFMEGDTGDSEQMDSAFKNTVHHFKAIDIIINNAGVMDDLHWEDEIKTNLHGCVIGTLLGMQYMAKSSSGQGGIIVNVGSIMSMIPSCGFPIYTMTQFGIAGFSKAMGSSYLFNRTGVKIFGYCPGLTDTKLLKYVSKNSINNNFASEFQEEIDGCMMQKPESVAKGLVNILEEAKPGSIWIAENNAEPYEVIFPSVANLRMFKKADAQ